MPIAAVDSADRQLISLVAHRLQLHKELGQARRAAGNPETRTAYDNWVLNHYAEALGQRGVSLALLLLRALPT